MMYHVFTRRQPEIGRTYWAFCPHTWRIEGGKGTVLAVGELTDTDYSNKYTYNIEDGGKEDVFAILADTAEELKTLPPMIPHFFQTEGRKAEDFIAAIDKMVAERGLAQ